MYVNDDDVPRNGGESQSIESERTLILLVEDNDDAREFICARLRSEFNVVEAKDGKEALQRAREQVPDLVISDVMMPEMDGYQLCREIKKDVRTSHIPVILLTALAEQSDKLRGLQKGADDYITKPFDGQELILRVRNLIDARKALQDKFRAPSVLQPGEVAVRSMDDEFLQKIHAEVEQHLREENFGVEQLATLVFLSRTQVHRKLKALTGMSATEFIRYLRLMRARDLLRKKAGTIGEITEMVGISNQSYFAKIYREQFGTLPSEVGNHQQ